MHLHSLYVENYRAVREASLTFNSTTVLIGENESGKSSLLHILKKILSPGTIKTALQFDPDHFHRTQDTGLISGPILIRICFSELYPEEWDEAIYQPISHLLNEKSNKKRKLIIEIKVSPVDEGTVEGKWKIFLKDTRKNTSDPKILQWCRKMNPVIHLTAGMLTGRGVDNIPEIRSAYQNFSESHEIKSVIDRIDTSASQLLSGTSTNNLQLIEEGYNAASRFIEYYRKQGDSRKTGLVRKVSDILGKDQDTEMHSLSPLLKGPTNTAKRLGVLLLVAAMIRTIPEGLNGEMDPIWIIEDPEAHLHPMTLASVNMLLDSIRWQKIITTYSGELLSKVPLRQIRKLHRYKGVVKEFRVKDKSLSKDDLRKISYHLRAYNSEAFFARLWLFVEGESEFWIIPQLAHILGYEFPLEGITCIVFAQAGLDPFIKVAEELGIEWHMLADGDTAGQTYKKAAQRFVSPDEEKKRITLLRDKDIEHCFWNYGYSDFYLKQARYKKNKKHVNKAGKIIKRAVKRHSKPYLSLSIAEAVNIPGSPGIPEMLKDLIETCLEMARNPSLHTTNSESHGNQNKD
ncbi:ATP-dependent endonuclease [Bacteroidota bacterium]